MGTYEDLVYDITTEVEKLGLRKEYDQKLGEFYNKLEEDEYKEDMN